MVDALSVVLIFLGDTGVNAMVNLSWPKMAKTVKPWCAVPLPFPPVVKSVPGVFALVPIDISP